MKIFASIAILAFVLNEISAQIAPIGGIASAIIPPAFPPMLGGFGGFGFPGFGLGLGFPFGLGLGGLGLGLGGFGRFGLGGFGFGGRLGGIRGKREVNGTEVVKCVLSTELGLLNCTGPHENIECSIEPHLINFPDIKLRLVDLVFKETEKKDLLKIVKRRSGKFTFVEPSTHKTVLLSLFSDPKVTEPGFFVKDATCFKEVVTLFKANTHVKVGLNINV